LTEEVKPKVTKRQFEFEASITDVFTHLRIEEIVEVSLSDRRELSTTAKKTVRITLE
jgi:hypothetical protein